MSQLMNLLLLLRLLNECKFEIKVRGAIDFALLDSTTIEKMSAIPVLNSDFYMESGVGTKPYGPLDEKLGPTNKESFC